ncbi:phytanoyl-CoA dioxygenase family protein [Embleya sp. NPDC001921]
MGPLSQLSQEEQDLLPSAADVEHYRNRGWYLSEPLLDDEEIDRVGAAVERFYAGHRDRRLPVRLPSSSYWTAADGDAVQRHNDYICYESDEIRRILCKPLIAAVAARLAATTQIRLWSSTLILKPPNPDNPTGVVPWHTDRHHWQTCTSDELMTAFIPLHDCGEDYGTLTVVDGSHRWRELPPAPTDDVTLHFADRPARILDEALEATARFNRAEIREVRLAIPKGRVSFHHCRTYHGSSANRMRHPRRVVTVRFQDASNRWRDVRKRDGSRVVYSHDTLVRKTIEGTPDYTDPEYCPVLWQENT